MSVAESEHVKSFLRHCTRASLEPNLEPVVAVLEAYRTWCQAKGIRALEGSQVIRIIEGTTRRFGDHFELTLAG